MANDRIICPFCNYRMPIRFTAGAKAHGLFVKCKGRNCGKVFEIVLPQTKIENPQVVP